MKEIIGHLLLKEHHISGDILSWTSEILPGFIFTQLFPYRTDLMEKMVFRIYNLTSRFNYYEKHVDATFECLLFVETDVINHLLTEELKYTYGNKN